MQGKKGAGVFSFSVQDKGTEQYRLNDGQKIFIIAKQPWLIRLCIHRYVVLKSTTHPDAKPDKKLVRGDVAVSGFIFQPDGSGSSVIRIVQVCGC